MIKIEVDQAEITALVKEHVKKLVTEADTELVFWDTKELRRRTCLSWSTIQEHFFFDSRFPKHKVGSKWLFPARATREFLELWLLEQPRN
uniref:group-specific protein n=1 Tax=Paenibacillus oryzisoli TaxID=1850517 RepID=UPI003D27D868